MRHGLILAGGGGTRLWPASRRSRPKQFLRLADPERSLLQATAQRLEAACDELAVVTAAEQVADVRAELPALPAHGVIAEPSARNTAAAIGLAAVAIAHRDPDAIIGAIPADQHIAKPAAFAAIVKQAFAAAESHDAIVTIGIVPTRAETGYGYLQRGGVVDGSVYKVERFVEKPDIATAERYLSEGNYLWNAGMFFTKASFLLDQIRTHMPETAAALDEIARAYNEGDAEAPTAALYPSLPSISIDYGVMERCAHVLTIPAEVGWSDVGSWSALADYTENNSDKNIIRGEAVSYEATGNILVADEGSIVAVAGVSDLIVVKHGDAVLVLPRDRAQDVKHLVDALKAGKLEQFL